MPRNKLPKEQKKVRFMTIYVEPKFIDLIDKDQVNKFITKLQNDALDKCVAEVLKNKTN
jgi:hypothetical protein